MLKLYEYYLDCGRMGSLSGLFVADDAVVEAAIGKRVYFGEVLGKHSEVYGTLDREELTVKSEDQEFIAKLVDLLGSDISGYNPLGYITCDCGATLAYEECYCDE